MRGLPPLLALALLAACTARGRPVDVPRPDPEVSRVIALAADQVKRCYRAPRSGTGARGIVTTLGVAYAPDGTLAELPVLIAQSGVTDDNRAFAAILAEAAAKAVVGCTPLRLPAAQYRGGWEAFRLSFGQRAAA